jgi:hypothetical protein
VNGKFKPSWDRGPRLGGRPGCAGPSPAENLTESGFKFLNLPIWAARNHGSCCRAERPGLPRLGPGQCPGPTCRVSGKPASEPGTGRRGLHQPVPGPGRARAGGAAVPRWRASAPGRRGFRGKIKYGVSHSVRLSRFATQPEMSRHFAMMVFRSQCASAPRGVIRVGVTGAPWPVQSPTLMRSRSQRGLEASVTVSLPVSPH